MSSSRSQCEPACPPLGPTPRVTVLTATYNGARFLSHTLDSILGQTFTDFEYIIIDDASTDESPQILQTYAQKDDRIRLVRNAQNLNPAGALNRGLEAARGEFVAILDHDDLALPERLARQVAFLDAHVDIGAVGAQARIIDENGAQVDTKRYPAKSAIIRWFLFFGAPILHSAAMYRRARLNELGGYSTKHPYLCDYELLIRLAECTRVANLQEELTCYRRSSTQVSSVQKRPQNGQMLLLQFALQQRWLGLRPDLRVFQTLLDWFRRIPPVDAQQGQAAAAWLTQLWKQYLAVTPLCGDELESLRRVMAQRWLRMAHVAYATQRPAARTCWHVAHELDPQIMQRPESWARLRKERRACAKA